MIMLDILLKDDEIVDIFLKFQDPMFKIKCNNVVEWIVKDVEEEDGVVITKTTLLLNNRDTGKSFLLDRSKDTHPSIYIGLERGQSHDIYLWYGI